MGPYTARESFPGGPSAPNPKKQHSSARYGMPRRRGRVGRPAARIPRMIYDQLRPKFIAFLCEWQGCPAELQNLETLRKHILVVHGRNGTCLWGKCADGPQLKLSPGGEFEKHVENTHLVPFAWHVGDGPRNTSAMAPAPTPAEKGEDAADNLPAYLFDGEGNQVTPSVLHQEFENMDEKKVRRRKLHQIMTQSVRNAREEDADGY